MQGECLSPDCQTAAIDGKWCDWHQDLFDRIREELDEGKAERRRSAGIKRTRSRYPQCARFECTTPAKPDSSLCLYHLRRSGTR
jgi:hypothetical protein